MSQEYIDPEHIDLSEKKQIEKNENEEQSNEEEGDKVNPEIYQAENDNRIKDLQNKISSEIENYNQVRADLGLKPEDENVATQEMKSEMNSLEGKNEEDDGSSKEYTEGELSIEDKKNIEEFSEEISVSLKKLNQVLQERENYGLTQFVDMSVLDSFIKKVDSLKESESYENLNQIVFSLKNDAEDLVFPYFRNGIKEGGNSLEELSLLVGAVASSIEEGERKIKGMTNLENEKDIGSVVSNINSIQDSFGNLLNKIRAIEDMQ